MIDVIGNEDFHYESQAGDVMRGAFDWELYYKRIPINAAEIKRRQFDTDPIKYVLKFTGPQIQGCKSGTLENRCDQSQRY